MDRFRPDLIGGLVDAMWIKRAPAEIVEVRRNRRRNRVQGAALFGVFILVMVSLTFGWRQGGERGWFFVPVREIVGRLPGAIFCGVLSGALYYGIKGQKPTVV